MQFAQHEDCMHAMRWPCIIRVYFFGLGPHKVLYIYCIHTSKTANHYIFTI